MSRNLRRGPATPGLRQTIGAATRATAAPKPAARKANEPTVARLSSDSLAAHQSDTPADYSTGKPTTPTEAGDPFHDDGKASRGAGMQWLDELGS
jgi:hypothetical protein